MWIIKSGLKLKNKEKRFSLHIYNFIFKFAITLHDSICAHPLQQQKIQLVTKNAQSIFGIFVGVNLTKIPRTYKPHQCTDIIS